MRRVFRCLAAVAAAVVTGGLVAACGSAGAAPAGRAATAPGEAAITAGELGSYVDAVEAVRLPVNQLLNGADPIIAACRVHRITPAAASGRMGALERRFAAYLVQMDAIAPANPALARINAPYARTYLLEDSYLATLASDLEGGDFGNLPDTQDQQRLAIIEWRTQLQLAASRVGFPLPADIQQAGARSPEPRAVDPPSAERDSRERRGSVGARDSRAVLRGNGHLQQCSGFPLNTLGGGGNRTRVLQCINRASPGAACCVFLSPGIHAGKMPTG